MTQESKLGMLSASLTLPRLATSRGPKTSRGKLHASRNAAKYDFSRFRTKRDQDPPLLNSICAVLVREQNEALGTLALDAIALELFKAYRIRCEIEETTRQCGLTFRASSDVKLNSHFKHLEGLQRYDRRSRSRLKSLLRPYTHGQGLKYSNAKRAIFSAERR